jgi:hypothetical protein
MPLYGGAIGSRSPGLPKQTGEKKVKALRDALVEPPRDGETPRDLRRLDYVSPATVERVIGVV